MKSKHEKILKIFGISLGILLSLILLIYIAVNIFIYYEFVDVSGLSFYKDDEIEIIKTSYERVYFIAEDGKGYVTGDNANSGSRTYRNAEFRKHKDLDMPSPILFWDGEIEALYPVGTSAHFITSDQTLYRWDQYDFEVKKIAESVVYVDSDVMKLKMDIEKTYFIDTDHDLWMIDHENEPIRILSDVKQVQGYYNRIWVIMNDGILYEVLQNEQGYTLSEPIFEDIVEFNVIETATRYKDKFVWDDEEALLNPLMHVLTKDGNLYAKGVYNSYNVLNEKYLQVHEIKEWKIIGENVSAYSVAPTGTMMKFQDGSCAYYGFNLQRTQYHEMIYQILPIENVKNVYASTFCVQVEDDNGVRYFWGNSNYNTILYEKEGHEDITSDEPLVLDYPF